MMLAPQYSLRRLLALVTASGFGCLVLALAVRGQMWAVAIAIGMLGLVVTILVCGLLFAVTRLLGLAFGRRKPPPAARTTTQVSANV